MVVVVVSLVVVVVAKVVVVVACAGRENPKIKNNKNKMTENKPMVIRRPVDSVRWTRLLFMMTLLQPSKLFLR